MPVKVGFLGGGNPHALAIARHFLSEDIDCFGIGRGPVKPRPLWLVPQSYRYYQAHIGKQNERVFEILDAEKPDVLVNLCAQGEGAVSFGPDSWRFYQTNCAYLAQLVDVLSRRQYLKHFVHISTSELYGSGGPFTEDSPLRPTSPYSISKATFDQHLMLMKDFPFTIVRPSNCLTEGMQLHRIVPRALIAASGGERLKLQGGGQAKKSFLHTHDLALAVQMLIELGPMQEVLNVGPDSPVSILEVVEICAYFSKKSVEEFADVVPAREGEDSVYWLASDRIKALGWKRTIDLHDAIDGMCLWVQEYKDELLTLPHTYRIAA